jgi:hypothetical protein
MAWRVTPLPAVKKVSIKSTCKVSGDIAWLEASAYLIEVCRTRLEDGESYLTCGDLFMCGRRQKTLLRFDRAEVVQAGSTDTRTSSRPSLTASGSIVKVTIIKMTDGKGNVCSVVVRHVNFVSNVAAFHVLKPGLTTSLRLTQGKPPW